MKSRTPGIDQHIREAETLVPCLACAPSSPRRHCPLCFGAGMVSKEREKWWREAHPLPPPVLPPKK